MQTTSTVSGLALRSAAPADSLSAYWVLRIGAALCFIGHGAFGFITKAAWLPYFGVVGIPESWAWDLMPVIGAVDVLAGMALLFGPTRLPVIYMAVWALWTAFLRPLAGESVFETLERAGNYGVPLAFLLLNGVPKSWRESLEDLPARSTTMLPDGLVQRVLQWTTCLLLVGHGALGVLGKSALTGHYAAIGLPPGATPLIGWFEILLAVLVAARPTVGLLAFVVGWKMATESLFLVAGAPIWEFLERGGSFAAPAALAVMLRVIDHRPRSQAERVRRSPGTVSNSVGRGASGAPKQKTTVSPANR